MTTNTHILERLSPRERSVAQHYANGLSHKAIAEQLSIAPVTVRNHIASIYRKLSVSNKAELANLMASAVVLDSIQTETAPLPAVDEQLKTWLENLTLGQYAQAFADCAIDSTLLADLDEQDLRALGITALGHRKILLKAIAQLEPKQLQPTEATVPLSDSAEAERRQLTLLICRLQPATTHARASDMEALQAHLGRYQVICKQVVNRYDGYLAHVLGATLHVYFGYPQAHEDNAERALRASLELRTALQEISDQQNLKCALSVAIATGPVIVDENAIPAQAPQVIGKTPSRAETLLLHAAPNDILIDAKTRHLLGALFEYQILTPLSVGSINNLAVWRVLGETPTESRFAALRGGNASPLVGRDEELSLLRQCWNQTKTGVRQVLVLSGEPGIGKSRLARAFADEVAPEPHTLLAGQCSPLHINSTLYPFIQLLENACYIERSDTAKQRLDKLEHLLAASRVEADESVSPLAQLLAIPISAGNDLSALSAQQRRVQILDALVGLFDKLAAAQNMLLILEDAHWLDPSSRELLDRLIGTSKNLPQLFIISCRSEYDASWIGESHSTLLPLKRLDNQHSQMMIVRLAGEQTLAPALVAELVDKTDGVPLFIEEMTKAVLEQERINSQRKQLRADDVVKSITIPSSLEGSLMARLDRTDSAKKIAQIAAVIGREFSYQLIAEVAEQTDSELQAALKQLNDAELIFSHGQPPASNYSFKHALVRDVAYQSLLKHRRQQLHTRIARVLEQRFQDQTQFEPELLARHYTEAGSYSKAADYWLKAGQQAHNRSAYLEALAFIDNGLALLKQSPANTKRTQRSLRLQITKARALMAVRGFTAPETGDAFMSARALCSELGDPPEVFAALRGMVGFFLTGAKYATARVVAEECLHLAQMRQDQAALADAQRYLGTVLLALGELPAARRVLEQAVAFDDFQQHKVSSLVRLNPRVGALIFLGPTLCLLGYPEQALVAGQDAVNHLQQLGYAHSQAMALSHLTLVRGLRREYQCCHELARRHLALAREHKLDDYTALGTVNHIWARIAMDESSTNPEMLKAAIEELQVKGFRFNLSFRLCGLAEVLLKQTGMEDTLTANRMAEDVMAEALTFVNQTDERWCETELWRLKGEWVLRKNHADADGTAEVCFQRGLVLAREQAAKWWELRSASSLARLWRDQGKRQDALDVLAPIYHWFSEGFDTPDLTAAKTLLSELSCR